jgi:dCMP deaminase
MEMAEVLARRSTCYKGGVGAILVRGVNIISTGYNGPPSGERHCHGVSCVDEQGKCSRSLHAERNAIDKLPVGECSGSKLYSTRVPCLECARRILAAGIEQVYYRHAFRDFQGLTYIIAYSNLGVYRVTANGFVENMRTKMLTEGVD